mmetsp:Transcript_253/g.705  ORF Transcript_253/g.705 Transcript_253/m.705 type:complete len:214 (+) Transcript_253:333-974(+)
MEKETEPRASSMSPPPRGSTAPPLTCSWTDSISRIRRQVRANWRRASLLFGELFRESSYLPRALSSWACASSRDPSSRRSSALANMKLPSAFVTVAVCFTWTPKLTTCIMSNGRSPTLPALSLLTTDSSKRTFTRFCTRRRRKYRADTLALGTSLESIPLRSSSSSQETLKHIRIFRITVSRQNASESGLDPNTRFMNSTIRERYGPITGTRR